MVFSSPIFLFAFLPVVLLFYYLLPRVAQNGFLLLASLLFYSWGEVFYVAVMVVSIISTYVIGLLLAKSRRSSLGRKAQRTFAAIGIVINIGLLVSFKYANFITSHINALLLTFDLSPVDLGPVHLPLGISFFTFQAVSYLVDVHRGVVLAQRNIFSLALYISLFPQLIAGPIVRYHDIAEQISRRTPSLELFASGIQRFIFGLAKKMLVANPLGEVADNVFSLGINELTMPLAWIGASAYALQIYYDFSGYSDMAIGLGRMFGFRYRENFNYPYIARNLRDFWRRWHISLSTWFRDYLYIPLGGGRGSQFCTYRNLLIVFFLVGIWHGASWNFVIWGMYHGAFLIIERIGFSNVLARTWRPINHLYVILVLLSSWVLFRADTLAHAGQYLWTMWGFADWHTTRFEFARVLTDEFPYVFVVGVMFSTPIYNWSAAWVNTAMQKGLVKRAIFVDAPAVTLLSTILMLSVLKIATSTYNPFIYFRF